MNDNRDPETIYNLMKKEQAEFGCSITEAADRVLTSVLVCSPGTNGPAPASGPSAESAPPVVPPGWQAFDGMP